LDVAVGRFGLCYGPFWLYDGPFWTTQWAVLDNFLGIKIFGAVLAMGRFGIVPLKASGKEQHSVIGFLWAKRQHNAQIPLTLTCVKCISVGLQVFYKTSNTCLVEKTLLIRNDLVAVLFRRPMQRSHQSIHSYGLFQTMVFHDMRSNVWRLNMFACWTCSLFLQLAMLFNTWQAVKENCWAKYCTDWLRSKYKWRHNNDVIITKIPTYVPN